MGEDVFELNFIPVAALANDVTATDANLALLEPLSGDPKKYTKGYVLLDNEMLRFEWNGGDGKNLGMPVRWDGTTGLYRGMFGTTAQSHTSAQSLVYGMPYRFSDTYKAQEFDNTMAYFQWSTKMDLAGWKNFRIDQEVFPADPNVVLHALVRVDGKGEFYDRPAVSDMTLLYESITGTGQINRVGHLNDAGQLDVRFYTEYKPGSFDATAPWNTMSWKKPSRIKQIQVDYDRPVQVLYHEDR